MAAPPSCPSCNTPLALFTPREAQSHVNACLDLHQNQQQQHISKPVSANNKPSCGVCGRDLSALTEAARIEHANRCADSILPLPQRPPPSRRRPRITRDISTNSNSNANRTNTATTTGNGSETNGAKGDSRVEHLLQMLGLQRYAKRFRDEEIDLVALRLLSDDDLAALSIPEAARRRIADTMHSIPILAQLQLAASQRQTHNSVNKKANTTTQSTKKITTGSHTAVIDDDVNDECNLVYAPTQKFEESRVGVRLGRIGAVALLDDDDDDDDDNVDCNEVYSPTPAPSRETAKKNNHTTIVLSDRNAVSSGDGREEIIEKRGMNNIDREEGIEGKGKELKDTTATVTSTTTNRDNDMESDEFREGKVHSSSEESLSSLASDLGDLDRVIMSQSQISVEHMLAKWRRRLIKREKRRHRKEMELIEEMHNKALVEKCHFDVKAVDESDDFIEPEKLSDGGDGDVMGIGVEPELGGFNGGNGDGDEDGVRSGTNGDNDATVPTGLITEGVDLNHSGVLFGDGKVDGIPQGDKNIDGSDGDVDIIDDEIIDLTQDMQVGDRTNEIVTGSTRVEKENNSNVFVISSGEVTEGVIQESRVVVQNRLKLPNRDRDVDFDPLPSPPSPPRLPLRNEVSESSSSSASPIDFIQIERIAAARRRNADLSDDDDGDDDDDDEGDGGDGGEKEGDAGDIVWQRNGKEVSNGGNLERNNDKMNRKWRLTFDEDCDDDSDFEDTAAAKTERTKSTKTKSSTKLMEARQKKSIKNTSKNREISFEIEEEKDEVEGSDDEIMDLIGNENDNEFGQSVFAATQEEEADAEEEDRAIPNYESRLKKKRKTKTKVKKASDDDIIKAIQSDDKLHEDVLMMECVEFGRFDKCVRDANVKVSKRRLHEFLLGQGVMFKNEAPTNTQSQHQYMRTLNTDARNPSD